MAGDLFYESEAGVGSTFHVEFGIGAEAEPAPQAAQGALQGTD